MTSRYGQKCITEGCDNYSAEWDVDFVLTAEGAMCMPCWRKANNPKGGTHE